MLVMISFKSILSSSCLVTIVELPSSDEMEMFYTEHNFQVDFENLRVQLEISCTYSYWKIANKKMYY